MIILDVILYIVVYLNQKQNYNIFPNKRIIFTRIVQSESMNGRVKIVKDENKRVFLKEGLNTGRKYRWFNPQNPTLAIKTILATISTHLLPKSHFSVWNSPSLSFSSPNILKLQPWLPTAESTLVRFTPSSDSFLSFLNRSFSCYLIFISGSMGITLIWFVLLLDSSDLIWCASFSLFFEFKSVNLIVYCSV